MLNLKVASIISRSRKRPVDSHISVVPAFQYSFNVCISTICRRHKESAHTRRRAVPLLCFRALLMGVKDDPVIIAIDDYQRQTPCNQTGQAGAADARQCSRRALNKWAVCYTGRCRLLVVLGFFVMGRKRVYYLWCKVGCFICWKTTWKQPQVAMWGAALASFSRKKKFLVPRSCLRLDDRSVAEWQLVSPWSSSSLSQCAAVWSTEEWQLLLFYSLHSHR